MKYIHKLSKLLITSLLVAPAFLSSCHVGSTKNTIVDFYCLNDVHGRILPGYNEPGLSVTNTYLKKLKQDSENFVFLNAGDHFQDTYDSAMNWGNCMAELLPVMETEAMTIGNHEFDWGVDRLIKNRQLANGTPFLGANIYHYDEMRSEVKDFANELCDPYAIIERDNIKIGVIGIIGIDQIQSITSKCTKGYTFVNPLEIVKNLSDELRTEKKCQMVICVAHADYNQLQEQTDNRFAAELSAISPTSHRNYLDAVFTAHSHKMQMDLYHDKLPFIQSGAHGQNLSHVRLEYKKGQTNFVEYNHLRIPLNLKNDPDADAIINKYITPEFIEEKNKQIGTLEDINGKLSRDQFSKMYAKMAYKELIANPDNPYKDVTCFITNNARSNIYVNNGALTRGLAFDAIPFTNEIHIAEIKGYDILNCVKFGNVCYAPELREISKNDTYKVAAIDYLMLHVNNDKKYNIFHSYSGESLFIDPRFPVDIVQDYFSKYPTLNVGSFINTNEFNNI